MIDRLKELKLIPVVNFSDEMEADGCFDALKSAGLPVAEVTLRNSAGMIAIEKHAAREDILIGAGTVLTMEQCKACERAGAKFIVSPIFDAEMFEYLAKRDILYIGGCVTPTEVSAAKRAGAKLVKFFPAEDFGGVKTLKSLSAVFPDMLFMPTGGVDIGNIQEYLNLKCVIAVGGSFMVKSMKFEDIYRRTLEAKNLL